MDKLSNGKKKVEIFGLDFHLSLLPCAFKRQLTFVLVAPFFNLLLHRADETQQGRTAVHGCILAFSLHSIMACYIFYVASALFNCISILFLAELIFHMPAAFSSAVPCHILI